LILCQGIAFFQLNDINKNLTQKDSAEKIIHEKISASGFGVFAVGRAAARGGAIFG
jgi:hypothetical protein